MAITNHERVGKMLELLRDGLAPFVERELKTCWGEKWAQEVRSVLSDTRLAGMDADPITDVAGLLVIMDRTWKDVFSMTLGKAERSMVNELIAIRNEWAHQRPFSSDNTYRGLDTASRVLASISAPQAEELDKMKMELLRLRFDEQVRTEKRRSTATAIESPTLGSLKPWREVVTPHADVTSGQYRQAEFAADLWQVHLGQGSDEYRDPVQFFRRTYLTESLKRLLVRAVQRLAGRDGDPVVQLQTNFGGGKTHSMLALYHLFSGVEPSLLPGIEEVVREAGNMPALPVRRVVLVGNKISPGNPVKKPDGTVVRTLWGELAWQLGGREAYEEISADDERATSPGDRLRELFKRYGPCLILIDEWVAYARQLHDQNDLPGGSFETQFTFAQTLTESARLAGNCLAVISLPASDTSGSPHIQANNAEVGGVRGREALDRLRNVIGRLESSWRPATAEESFEIVRRRLFEPLAGAEAYKQRDVTARAFADFYRQHRAEFPPECAEREYEQRLKAAYPIHPEVFDQLYGVWSTLLNFQRTRGVLRLMAAVIHCLWEKGDRSPLILPASLPLDDSRVQFELTRYLSDNWVPIIERDVDGADALPLKLDAEQHNLGRYSAARRVARTIFLGSAPNTGLANRGLEDRRVKLGCAIPDDSLPAFGDALRRLAAKATFLYQDGNRFWYDTQHTVTKLAEDRAEQLKTKPDSVVQELEKRVCKDIKNRGDFCRIHPLPKTSSDVADELTAGLVILGTDHPHSRDTDSPALDEARAILETRGSVPRLHRNTLAFLAIDKTRLQDLEEAIRRYLAWQSIVDEAEVLNLNPHQSRQAQTQKDNASSTIDAQIPEAYIWLLVPYQSSPQQQTEWKVFRLSGQEPLAVRASRRMRNDELLVTGLAATRLRDDLDKIPLWRGDHVEIRQLVEDFARYIYLLRLRDPGVLVNAIRQGVAQLTWPQDSFAYAESYDPATSRYRGMRCGQNIAISKENLFGLLVKPDVALRQYEAERAKSAGVSAANPGNTGVTSELPASPTAGNNSAGTSGMASLAAGNNAGAAPDMTARRFFGTVQLDPNRVGRDAGRIADEVITHLSSILGSDIQVTLEIDARVPTGVPENIVRVVTENCRTLKFKSQGFQSS